MTVGVLVLGIKSVDVGVVVLLTVGVNVAVSVGVIVSVDSSGDGVIVGV